MLKPLTPAATLGPTPMTRKHNPFRSPRRLPSLAAFALVTTAGVAFAGPLNPPAGPVTSTYKTLTEVEPRTAINATNTPGDADTIYKITQPGSYYLTGNITGVAAKHGIEIAVVPLGPSVTIDLMGYELAGVAGSLDGIAVTVGSTRNVAVRNGTARAWGGDGVDVINSSNNLLDGLRVEGNGGLGISAGTASTVTGCTASSNTGDGIFAQFGSTVTGCTAFTNTGDGIFAGSGSTVTGCTAFSNTGDGIQVVSDCRVTDNTCDSNGAGDGAGIHATGSDNRIEGNNCTDADRGIDVDNTGNIIIRNTCSSNAIDWTIAANNVFGPIIDRRAPASPAVSGFTAASTLGSTDPNANFTY